MDILQEGLNQTLKDVPSLILQNLISKKLRKQGITASKDLSSKLAKHILCHSPKPFKYRSRKVSGKIDLAFDQDDLNEIDRDPERFQTEQLPKLLPEVAHRISKIVLKDMKARWPNEQTLQQADLSGFRERLEERWGHPLGQLRMLLTICREWCEWIHKRNVSQKGDPKKKQLQSILIRLLTRGYQVTDEILCLLENGFADGAMARWRTLHEISGRHGYSALWERHCRAIRGSSSRGIQAQIGQVLSVLQRPWLQTAVGTRTEEDRKSL